MNTYFTVIVSFFLFAKSNIHSLKNFKNNNEYRLLPKIRNWVLLRHWNNILIFAMNNIICYNWSSSSNTFNHTYKVMIFNFFYCWLWFYVKFDCISSIISLYVCRIQCNELVCEIGEELSNLRLTRDWPEWSNPRKVT